MAYVKQAKWAYLIASAALIAFGACLILWPGLSAETLCLAGGVFLAVFGAVKLACYFSKDRFGLAFQFDFALGIFALAAGVAMILRPERIVTALPILAGVFIIIDGVFKLQTALDAKRFGLERWGFILALAALTCACGGVLVAAPFQSAQALTVLLGVTLAVDGAQNLCVVLHTVRSAKKDVIDIHFKEI